VKTHTSDFKNKIKEFGRELDSLITYTISGTTTELGNEELNSVSPHYEGAILKSVMKQLDIDSNVDIPVGTEINYQFGVKTRYEEVENYRDNYDYIDYGNYIVYSSEKQEDTRSWKIICYDKMLYAMKDYENSNITYPITIRNYISAICTKIGLTFANASDTFANYDKQITSELYLDSDGNSLGYTFRDVLDELAEATGSTICINDDDELEIKYIDNINEIINLSGTSITIKEETEPSLTKFEIEGKTTQATSESPVMPSPDYPSPLISVGYENIFNGATWRTCVLSGGLPTSIGGGTTVINSSDSNNVNFSMVSNYDGVVSAVMPVEPSTNYILSFKLLNGQNTARINILSYSNYTYTILGNQNVNQTDGNKKYLVSIPSNVTQIVVMIAGTTTKLTNCSVTNIQLEKGFQVHSYISPNKYGIEVKITGKNLFDKNDLINGYIQANGILNVDSTARTNNYFIPVEYGQQYSLSGTNNGGIISLYDNNYNFISNNIGSQHDGTFTINAYYVKISVNYTLINSVQFQKGATTTQYEQYVSNTNLYVLDNPLRSVGDTKDLLYIKNGMLYVKRYIGNITFDGSSDEIWTYEYNGGYMREYISLQNSISLSQRIQILSNRFIYGASGSNMGTGFIFASKLYLYTPTDLTSANLWKTWLSTHNTEVQYVLETPTIEVLGEVSMPTTYNGTTHIGTVNINELNMNVSYVKKTDGVGIDEINEEYLKDVNVNFAEKFGAVNTLILSRSADTDKISLSMPNDLADEDKVAIQITDNQIMNDNNRYQYMQDILTKLYGLEYYINDYSSTGICYLDLCDRYNVKIGENTYKCIMFNDEVNVTQGLEEFIYTDMQEENEQEYKYMDSTDQKIQQTSLIVNKQKGEIEAKVSKDEIVASLNLAIEEEQGIVRLTGNQVTIDSDNFKLYSDGSIECNNAQINGTLEKTVTSTGTIKIGKSSGRLIEFNFSVGDDYYTFFAPNAIAFTKNNKYRAYYGDNYLQLYDNSGNSTIYVSGSDGNITCVSLTQTSKEENKKNFEKLNNALDIVKNTDIYKYNFNFEDDETKKHIGFVIGKNYNYSKEITSIKDDGADIYSLASVCLQAIKEQQEQIEDLKQRIERLESEVK